MIHPRTRVAYLLTVLRKAGLVLLLPGLSLVQGVALAQSVQQSHALPSGEEITFEVFGQGNRLREPWITPNF